MGATDKNQLSTLLGVEAHSYESLGIGLGLSPLSNAAMRGAKTRNTVFSHFTEQTIPNQFKLVEEGTAASAATYGLGIGGEATITSDDVTAKSDQLATGLCWQADRQSADEPLVAEVRWKSGATITTVEYWMGLTDASTDTDPIALSSTSTFTTSVPTDGVYMGFSTTPTSGAAYTAGGNNHTAISIIGNTNAVVGTGYAAFTAATYYTYRFEVDYLGNCKYYINGQLMWTKLLALTPSVPLCLMLCVTPRTTSERVLTVDYAGISGV